jgi:hypothetical protein
MMNSDMPNDGLDPGFFDGRYMVEIGEWDWSLFVGLSPETTPVEYRFQGGLIFTRGIEIVGRIRAPAVLRGKLIRIWISPFGPEINFGGDGLDRVGRFYVGKADPLGSDFQASLHLPESALAPALTCLTSIWKYLDLWTADYGNEQASITSFCFSACVHPNLAAWAGPELDPR